MNMSCGLAPDERLASDRQFTVDLVQLVDTLFSATDAWNNMTQVLVCPVVAQLPTVAQSG